jgi:hypothetical protein
VFDGLDLKFTYIGVTSAETAEVVARLRRVADELEAGILTAPQVADLLHVRLGTDTDGTPGVNLPDGGRTLILRCHEERARCR